jgi:UDP-N-acetylglucosamine--N-acetylmuramyl-(pentapeptide) pyrophosphoryl-undecaprenol N-acetylglucosamine transferase
LKAHGCDVALLISPKEVDQQAAKSAVGMEVITLPAVAMVKGSATRFLGGCWGTYRLCRSHFKKRLPQAVIAMGGFTSVAPVLAGKRVGAATFLHEANTIPGRANRWLAPWVDEAFVFFPETAARLRSQNVAVTGMPVRPQFVPMDQASCRMSLGLHPDRPVLLVMGGSQGAHGINALLIHALSQLSAEIPRLQFLHLTGLDDAREVGTAYADRSLRALVRPFISEMELALGAATLAVSRAGASSLAELAAMRLPAILIPYPAAADNHQLHNARSLQHCGAAVLMEQRTATPEELTREICARIHNERILGQMRQAMGEWHQPHAAAAMARRVMELIGLEGQRPAIVAPVLSAQDPQTPPATQDWDQAQTNEPPRHQTALATALF